MAQLIPIQERAPGEKLSYVQGYRAGLTEALEAIEKGLEPQEIRNLMDHTVNLVLSTFSPTEEAENGD